MEILYESVSEYKKNMLSMARIIENSDEKSLKYCKLVESYFKSTCLILNEIGSLHEKFIKEAAKLVQYHNDISISAVMTDIEIILQSVIDLNFLLYAFCVNSSK